MAAPITRPRVFLDIQIGTEPAGRLVIELFVDKTPKTSENFRALCTGELGRHLSYIRAPFHRIIEDFMVQGGDITKGNGTGGKSIYGKEFEDENIGWRKIDKEGLICMANRGKSTNSSQFFITLAPCEHLNAKHTVFGHVVSGQQVLDKMAKLKVDKKDQPYEDVLIAHCGELERRKKPTQSGVKGRSKERVPQRSPSTDEGRRGRKRQRQDSDIDEKHNCDDFRSYRKSSPRSKSRSPSRHRSKQQRKYDRSSSSGSPSLPPKRNRHHRRRSISLDSTLRGRSRIRSASRTSSPRPSSIHKGKTIQTSSRSPPRHSSPRHQRSPRYRPRSRSPTFSRSPPLRRRHRIRSHSRSRSVERDSYHYHRHRRPSWHSRDYHRRPKEPYRYNEERRADEDRIRREEEARDGGPDRFQGIIEDDGRNGRGGGYDARGGDHWYRPSWGHVDYGDSGRLGGAESAVGGTRDGDGEVKFKGRGSMKYRERRW
ncbi:MAG: hypothetical protein M1813_002472 [Trichoglossum hirsutum]|nr:MAG: hypothetical protein M1813_002472 [Trichoglossum hirsutum]